MKSRKYFPDPREATFDGIVAMSDEISVDILKEAYEWGIFPWPHPDLPCLWFCPDERGVLEYSNLHIGRSLKKALKKTPFHFTMNQDFARVMASCSKVPRPGQDGTWITPPIMKAYEKFHEAGYAHSFECWDGDVLVGGLYGVYTAGVFSGESMFYHKSNASKFCLIKLTETLQSLGLGWMDIQMITPLTEALGGRYISKSEFFQRRKDPHAHSPLTPQEFKKRCQATFGFACAL